MVSSDFITQTSVIEKTKEEARALRINAVRLALDNLEDRDLSSEEAKWMLEQIDKKTMGVHDTC